MDTKSTLDEKKASFQSEDIPHRLGHIASNLARVRSFCNDAFKKGVEVVIDETEWFIAETYSQRVLNMSGLLDSAA